MALSLRIRGVVVAVTLFASAACFSHVAHAQTTADNRTLAQSLFDEGRRLVEAGDFARACPKLEESQRLDPGVGTQLNIAHCYELAGRTASAWSAYVEAEIAAKNAGQNERAAYAHDRATALAPALSRLTITPSSQRLTAFTVARDGQPLGASALGTAVAVDPGEHTIEVTAPGYRSWSTTVQSRAGSQTKLVLPALAPVPAAQEQRTPGASSLEASSPFDSTRGKVAVATGAAGLIALGFGGVLAIDAKVQYDHAVRDDCRAGSCSAAAFDATAAARNQGNWATALCIAGGALTGAGLVLWFTAPAQPLDHAQTAPRVRALRVGANTLALEGAF